MQRRRLALVVLLVAVVVAALTVDPVHEAIERALASAKQIIRRHEVLGVMLFMFLSAASAIAFFFSSAVLVPVAVYAWGKPTTILLLWLSWLFGAVASYLIGSRPGRRLARWIVPGRRIARYEKAISAKANFPLVLLFQLAVPSEVPGYVLGAVRYHFGRYLGARALAEVPFAVGAVYLGDTFVRRQYVPLAAIAVTGALISAVALYLLHRRIAGTAGGDTAERR